MFLCPLNQVFQLGLNDRVAATRLWLQACWVGNGGMFKFECFWSQ